MIHLSYALGSRPGFLELLQWHPRDVDTLKEIVYRQASEARMNEARERTQAAMGRG